MPWAQNLPVLVYIELFLGILKILNHRILMMEFFVFFYVYFISYISYIIYYGLIAQSVRASERNSVVVGSSPTQANFL